MRKIPEEKNESNFLTPKRNTVTINLELSDRLVIKCRNFLKSQHLVGRLEYRSVSDLMIKSIEVYKNGLINLKGFNWELERGRRYGCNLPLDLFDFYQEQPDGFRRKIVENCINKYLELVAGLLD